MPEDARKARKLRSEERAKALFRHLRGVLADPVANIENHALREALKSQGRLAGYSLKDKNIERLALNTLKVAASVDEIGGFDALDALRLACQEAIDAAESEWRGGNKGTKVALRQMNASLDEVIKLLREDLMVATQALATSLRNARSYASNADAATQERCARECREINAALGLVRTPLALKWIEQLGVRDDA